MINRLKQKIKEASLSIIPIMIIMIILCLFLGFNSCTILSIFISTILLILGMGLFTFGADLSMMEIGKSISSKLMQTKKVSLILIVSVIVGIGITIAEPDLKVLAQQMTAIDSNLLIICVSIGVGIFLGISALRILFNINLKVILTISYLILMSMLIISNKQIIPVAFDSGGVTTGPMTVPFILSMGLGFSIKSEKRTKSDSFGLVALCSIGPIITVLVLGLILSSDMSYTYELVTETTTFSAMIHEYIEEILPVLKDVIMSLMPILILFIIFTLITGKTKKIKMFKICVGLISTVLGLILFFIGVNVGYMKAGYMLGMSMFDKLGFLLIPIGMLIGFVIVKAEPAVAVLTEQIQRITQGKIKKDVMVNCIAVGVACAVGISIFRVITGASITPVLLVGYIVAIMLMYFTPNSFTMVAFDSGGAVTGPMTTTFLLPLIIGMCYSKGGNIMTDAFGLVALVAMSPLITIQILGIVYKNLKKEKIEC